MIPFWSFLTLFSVLHSLWIQCKIFKGEKVLVSEANLISILAIWPFQYKLKIEQFVETTNEENKNKEEE